MHTALTIAGSDSGAGAGIQADLKTFAAFGVYGTSVITAVTAQNTMGVSAVLPMPPDLVAAQIEAVLSDFPIGGIKTGMLASAAIAESVAAAIARAGVPLVVDPVMVAKSGHRLLDDDAVEAVKTRLIPLARLVTPNRPEAEVLADMPIASVDDARNAARRIQSLGAGAVVIKGGHFEGSEVINLLWDGSAFTEFSSRRLITTSTHGTGCTFAAALAALLAQDRAVPEAVLEATSYVSGAIAHAVPIGRGHGPLDHFWRGVPSRTPL